jgi:hypothetical protein
MLTLSCLQILACIGIKKRPCQQDRPRNDAWLAACRYVGRGGGAHGRGIPPWAITLIVLSRYVSGRKAAVSWVCALPEAGVSIVCITLLTDAKPFYAMCSTLHGLPAVLCSKSVKLFLHLLDPACTRKLCLFGMQCPPPPRLARPA